MKRKIYKIAKELNLASQTIIDFLQNNLNEKATKKHLTPVEEDIYVKILKNFNNSAYKNYTAKLSSAEETQSVPERKIKVSEREKELDEILSAPTEKTRKSSSRRIKKGTTTESTSVPVSVSVEETKKKETPKKVETKSKPEVKKEKYPKKDFKKSSKTDKGTGTSKNETKSPKSENPKKFEDSKGLKKQTKGKKPFPTKTTEEEKLLKAKNSLKTKKHKKNFINPDGAAGKPSWKSTKNKRKKVEPHVVKDSIKETLKKMNAEPTKSFKKIKKKKKSKETGEIIEVEVNVIPVIENISTSELANKLEINVTDLITKCFNMGMLITINQRLDKETIELIASEYDFEVEFTEEYGDELIPKIEDKEEDLKPRQPVVTIMGHVDHGKTSLLDHIRHSKVVAGESGGITQHIGAYEVVYNEKHITFIDTPGHAAFTAMRARGAKVTDVVVIVVAADDKIMPQTIEAIDHAKAANVPMVFAINKMDKPAADPEKIKTGLSQINILVEEWGGTYQCIPISAKTGMGIDDLLDSILIESEMLELKSNPQAQASGTVIESRLDKGLGPIATVLIERGTLKKGNIFVCGKVNGRVRALLNERMKNKKEAIPGMPAVILGFNGVPTAGDKFVVMNTEHEAKQIALKRQQLSRVNSQHKTEVITLDQVSQQIKLGAIKELNILLKGDVDGSVEAISDTIMKLSNNEVAVRIIRKSVGGITENDVLLAKASKAIIMGFHVRPNFNARSLAETEKIEIRTYDIIYELIQEVRDALEGMLSPAISEKVTGLLEIRDTFKVPKAGTIAGCSVKSGKIYRNAKIKIIRDDIYVYTGKISSLKRFKDDVKEVLTGFECGISVDGYNDIKVNDIIEVFEIVETKRKLEE